MLQYSLVEYKGKDEVERDRAFVCFACGGKSALTAYFYSENRLILKYCTALFITLQIVSLSLSLHEFVSVVFSTHYFWFALEPLERQHLTVSLTFQFNIFFVCVNRFEFICHFELILLTHISALFRW